MTRAVQRPPRSAEYMTGINRPRYWLRYDTLDNTLCTARKIDKSESLQKSFGCKRKGFWRLSEDVEVMNKEPWMSAEGTTFADE